MSLEHIRDYYRVPARRGVRVKFTYPLRDFEDEPARVGTIKGAKGSRLWILWDGEEYPMSYHPTWNIEYL